MTTTSAPSPEELAAIPTAIAAIQAFQAFKNALGPNPLLWPAKIGGAEMIYLGTLQNLVPSLLVSEGAALGASLDNVTNGWIAALQARMALAPPTAAPAA